MHTSEIEASISPISLQLGEKSVRGKKISVSSVLETSRQKAWAELQKTSLLRFVSAGMTDFGELPEQWQVGEDVQTKVKAKLFGCIPLGVKDYSVLFTQIDNQSFRAQTEESGDGIQIWDHSMSMEALTPDTTKYTDEVVIYAGILTGIIGRHTKALYTHRHEKWREVIDILRRGETTSDTQYQLSPLIT